VISEWLADKECSRCPCNDEDSPEFDTCECSPLSCPKLRKKYYKPSAVVYDAIPHQEVDIQCSNCGKRVTFKYSPANAKKRTDEGWNSFGDALYCPECSATWEERNGTDRPQWGAKHTQEKIKDWYDWQNRRGER